MRTEMNIQASSRIQFHRLLWACVLIWPAMLPGAESVNRPEAGSASTNASPQARWPQLFEQSRRVLKPNDALRAILAGHQGPGLAAEFTEEKHITVLDRPLQSSGTLIYQEAFGFYRKMTAPFQQELLIGRKELLRREEDGRVETVSGGGDAMVKTFTTAFLSLFSGSWKALDEHFAVHHLADAEGWMIGLVPKNKTFEKLVSGIVLRGRDAFLTDLWILEARGDWTHAVFTKVRKLNAKEAKELEPFLQWRR